MVRLGLGKDSLGDGRCFFSSKLSITGADQCACMCQRTHTRANPLPSPTSVHAKVCRCYEYDGISDFRYGESRSMPARGQYPDTSVSSDRIPLSGSISIFYYVVNLLVPVRCSFDRPWHGRRDELVSPYRCIFNMSLMSRPTHKAVPSLYRITDSLPPACK